MEENKTKVWAVKEISVKYFKTQPTGDVDEYPYYATQTTTYRVFVSTDISVDMSAAQNAVKEITEKSTTEKIKLTLETRTISEGMQFSKEMTQHATELLSAVMPQYQFEATESDIGLSGLKYEIEAKRNVVAKRRKVIKYILFALLITAIIPYKHIQWASYVVLGVYALFAVTIIYCLLVGLMARLLKVGKIGVSIGVTPRICLYDSTHICIHCGPIPFPDIAMNLLLVQQHHKAWSVSTIPVYLIILFGVAFTYLRNYLFESSPESTLSILPIHSYSIAAILAIACFFVSIITEIINLKRWKNMYPQLKTLMSFFETILITASFISVFIYNDIILKFIGL